MQAPAFAATTRRIDSMTNQDQNERRSLETPPGGGFTIAKRPANADRQVRLSVVIPTYNEAENVSPLVRALSELLEAPLAGEFEIIVVDDDSRDLTWQVAERAMSEFPKLRVVRRQGERGLSTAVIRGWQIARGEVLAVIDGDLQHPPEVMVGLWDEIARGADMAVGSRHVAGGGVSDWSMHRRALSRGAQMLGLALLPTVVGRVSDPMSGYFMLKRSAIEDTRLSPLGYKILIEVLGRGRFAMIREVGYVFRERVEGESKVTWKVYVDYFRHLARLRLQR